MSSRFDDRYSTGRQRRNDTGFDYAQTFPDTVGDQLRLEGYSKGDQPQGSDGLMRVKARYPIPGNAGFDTDNDADDYNTAAYQQPASTTSSSGPP